MNKLSILLFFTLFTQLVFAQHLVKGTVTYNEGQTKQRIMKNIKLLLLLIIGLLANSCELDEDPPFLDDTVFDNLQGARAAMDGIYQSLTSYGAQEQRIFAINGFSGLFVTRKNGGNNRNNVNNANLFSLKPVYDLDSENMWGGLYQSIARANTAIANIETHPNPVTNDEIGFNDIAGHAYFVRAWSYFSIVRLWGDIPMWLEFMLLRWTTNSRMVSMMRAL